MVRKVIGFGTLAAMLAVVLMQVLVSVSVSASAQSASGRKQGCFDSSGKHHPPAWCAANGKIK